jgi:hypothetical protein
MNGILQLANKPAPASASALGLLIEKRARKARRAELLYYVDRVLKLARTAALITLVLWGYSSRAQVVAFLAKYLVQ